MLAQILAIAVAVGSGLLFITAFIFPKLHRQDDFFWGSVGFFYALVLWVCAGQMAGAVLLGQLASVILLGWLAWEMLRLRQAIADPAKIPNLDKVSLIGYVKERFNKPKPAVPAKSKKESKPKPATPVAEPVTEATATPTEEFSITPEAVETALEIIEATEKIASPEAMEVLEIEVPEVVVTDEPEAVIEAIAETPEIAEIAKESVVSETPAPEATSSKKGFSLGRLFGRKDEAKPETSNPQSLDDIFGDEPELETDTDTASHESETPVNDGQSKEDSETTDV